MAEFSLTVEAAVHGYHAYMEQWEAAVDTTHYFKCELGERDNSLDSTADDDLCIRVRNEQEGAAVFHQKFKYDPTPFRWVLNN